MLLALLAVVALLLPGCGGGDKKTIPRAQGAVLIRQLKKARAAAGNKQSCAELIHAVAAAQTTVQALPASVDHNTRDSLTNGINNLDSTARQECANATTNTQTTTTPTATTPPPTVTPTTNTQTTPTTTTQTTPTTSTHTTPTSTTPTTPGNGGATPGTGSTPPGHGGTPPGQKKKPGAAKGPKK